MIVARIVVTVVLQLAAAAIASAAPIAWKTLQPGVELATIAPGPLYVVRVDPARATLTAGIASETKGGAQTAAAWCRTSHLAVATNVGMFNDDHRTHTGYLRHGAHVNSSRWNTYQSVLALRPTKPSLHPILWLDRDQPQPPATLLAQYDLVLQNLRLIAAPGRNVWAQSDRRWSEAALAIDTKGRLLILFSRAPYTMHDFNTHLLHLPLDIHQAMHLEGGPEASLSIHVPGLDLCGSYETGFMPDDSNREQWELPNVLGWCGSSPPRSFTPAHALQSPPPPGERA
jgi:hypothetical protein